MPIDEANDDWEKSWDLRLQAIERVLGPSDDVVYHAVHPFELGGQADVIRFRLDGGGFAFVTADLTGPEDRCYADYELMICCSEEGSWAPNVISRLAPYTLSTDILAGETMDMGSAVPADSSVSAFVFDTFATFAAFGRVFDLRLCVGITKAELEYKFQHGSKTLLERLRKEKVYPFTSLGRASIRLD